MNTAKEELSKVYLISTLAFMLVLPASFVGGELAMGHGHPWALLGKWFVFWGIGVRLLLAGARQTTQPGFTAREIFRLTDAQSYPIVRELGSSNLCAGSGGVLTLFLPSWRLTIAFTGGLYFGLAGIAHAVKGAASPNERLAMVTDILFFALVAVWLAHTVFAA